MANIVLIGPMAVGKSTTAELLSKKLGKEHISIDVIRGKYFEEIGYDESVLKDIFQEKGFMGIFDHWRKFEIHAVERVMEDYNDVIMDFGAGFSMFEGEDLERAKQALKDHNVILLIPSEEFDRSREVSLERHKLRLEDNPEVDLSTLEFIEYAIKHPAHKELADHTIYNDGIDPDDVVEKIIQFIEISSS